MNWKKILTNGFWEQFSIALFYGDKHFPSDYLYKYWRSYEDDNGKFYFRNWAILKDYLKD